MEKNTFRDGVKASLPTAFGYVSIGIACGVVGASAGLTPLQMGLMSALIYGGSAQFAFCALVVAGAGLPTLVLTVFLVNLRNFLMSLHATTVFPKVSLWNGIGIGSLITDESYGVMLNEYVHNKTISPAWMHGNNLTGYVTWILSVYFATILGAYIPDPEVFGLDFALVAMFVSIFDSQISAMVQVVAKKKIFWILLAVTIAYVLLTFVVSESAAVLLSTLIGCFVGMLLDDK
ncbi:AzlC family ABC transporter permease [Streptococcus loxodontisalivarius]|uniref:4-azaleucine resistance transporter AzlC n=1 Tax=Streptococcus loxodontisalivarius TaxID=1349415 RepID=A0ABS2PRZ4_9STRE|nr:AzlC family ABC transporter permease [Streptococcus loxodontisalivarius]MBM7642812.1 4-azaleucine resistance transporter AzlC [Streptococcus loxodontisalivarius]